MYSVTLHRHVKEYKACLCRVTENVFELLIVLLFVQIHQSYRLENKLFNAHLSCEWRVIQRWFIHIDRPDRSYVGPCSKRQDTSNEGIELQSTPNQRVEAVLTVANFKYLNSLLVKETHDTIFSKKTRPTYPLTMGPLLI